jgi:hypothetical protein
LEVGGLGVKQIDGTRPIEGAMGVAACGISRYCPLLNLHLCGVCTCVSLSLAEYVHTSVGYLAIYEFLA